MLIREIKIDTTRCDAGCVDCEKACPLNLITVKVLTQNGKEISPEEAELLSNPGDLKVKVDVESDLCPCCMLCEMRCPKGAIHMRKIMHGILAVNSEKCPEGCRDCLDVCPIPGALILPANDSKVHPNETFCVFCGACKIVCPVEGALVVERKMIRHTPVSSGAWNTALEKLTSTKEYSKEARIKGSAKARSQVGKRLIPKGAS